MLFAVVKAQTRWRGVLARRHFREMKIEVKKRKISKEKKSERNRGEMRRREVIPPKYTQDALRGRQGADSVARVAHADNSAR
jgi:hypothetical protein